MFDQLEINEGSIDFDIFAYTDLRMQFIELNSLMFGSYIPDSTEFVNTFGSEPVDSEMQVFFKDGDDRIAVKVSPMSDEQTRATFLATPNLESFMTEPKVFDTRVGDFFAGLPENCLMLHISVGLSNVARGQIRVPPQTRYFMG